MQNREKKNEGGFYVLLLLFLAGSALFPKKIKQPTIRPRSVCVHACQILRSFSTLVKWSLFFSVSFGLTLFCHCHQYFKTHLQIYFQLNRNTQILSSSKHQRIYRMLFSSHSLFLAHAFEILSTETNVNVEISSILAIDVMTISQLYYSNLLLSLMCFALFCFSLSFFLSSFLLLLLRFFSVIILTI